MATTWDIRPISPVRWQEKEAYRNFKLHAGQTFLKGAPLIFATDDNTVEEGGTDPTPIVGFAAADADGYDWQKDTFQTVFPSMPVALAEGNVFRGSLIGTYDADVHVLGWDCGIVEDGSSGYWGLDETDESNVLARIVGFEDGVADGDVNIPVLFVVIEADRTVIV